MEVIALDLHIGTNMHRIFTNAAFSDFFTRKLWAKNYYSIHIQFDMHCSEITILINDGLVDFSVTLIN